LEALSPEEDAFLPLVVMALRNWATSALKLKFILGLYYLGKTGRKGLSKHHGHQAILCTDQGKKLHLLAKYPLVVREDVGGCVSE
jgi:hypothetical protein